MTYCYTPMDSPDFFAGESDCLTSRHDLKVKHGGLAQNVQRSISAILIQLNTDARSKGERGWWGNQFQPFEIGNRLWTISGNTNAAGVVARADEAIRAALQPLIGQGLIDRIDVNVVRTIGGIEATVDAYKNDENIFSSKLS
jgi:phage gp46-like protein